MLIQHMIATRGVNFSFKAAQKLAAELAQERMEQNAQTLLETFPDSGRTGYLLRRTFDEVTQVVDELYDELSVSAFRPKFCELEFSARGALPGVAFAGERCRGVVEGFVDRVDVWQSGGRPYVRVVDYKTGKKSFDYTNVLHGRGLQMLLYLFALEENGAREFGGPVKPAGVLYFPARCNLLTLPQPPAPDALAAVRQKDLRRQGLLLDDEALLQAMEPAEGTPRYLPYSVKKDGRSGDLASPAQLALLRQHVRRLLAGMTDELFAGKITANPYSRGATGACTYCDYAPICHPDPSQLRRLQATGAAEFWARLAKEEEEHGKV